MSDVERSVLRSKLEPLPKDLYEVHTACALSSAISLKRIADVLQGTPEKLGLADAIQFAIENAIYQASQQR